MRPQHALWRLGFQCKQKLEPGRAGYWENGALLTRYCIFGVSALEMGFPG